MLNSDCGAAMLAQVQDTCAKLHFHFSDDKLEGSQEFLRAAFACAGLVAVDLSERKNLPPDGWDRARVDVLAWLNSTQDVDVEAFGLYLKAADTAIKQLVGSTAPEGRRAYDRLKRSVCTTVFESRHFAIAKPWIEAIAQTRNPSAFYCANTWFNFLRRVNLPGLDLSSRCEEEYVSNEVTMREWVYPA